MPDRKHTDRPAGLRPEADHPLDEQLWDALETVADREPSENLRRNFYHALSEAARPPWWRAWLDALRHPLVPAFATLVIGLAIGSQLGAPGQSAPEIDALRAEVESLNTTVALTLMDKDSAGERLQGITVAANLGPDPRLGQALLQVAANDSSTSVRSAAIDALGPHMQRDAGIAAEIERLLMDTSSPLVQLALAELIMRFGENDQLRRLIDAAEGKRLLPDVNDYITNRIERNQA